MIGEFEQSVRMHPHRTFFAFVAKDGSVESYTYWEARLLSAAIARRLMDHGVRQGDYVAVDLANHPMLVFLSLAAAYGGFGLVLLNHRLTEAEKMSRLFDMERAPGVRLSSRLNQATAEQLMETCVAQVAGLPVGAAAGALSQGGASGPLAGFGRRSASTSISFDDASATKHYGIDIPTRAMRARARDAALPQPLQARPASHASSASVRRGRARQQARVQAATSRAEAESSIVHFAEHAVRVFSPSARAVVMFTSGSTGRSKAVPLTWNNLCSSARIANRNLSVSEASRWQLALPLYHVGGFQMMVRSVLADASFTLYEGFNPRQLLDDAPRIGATHVSVVDKMLQDLLDLAESSAAYKQALRGYRCVLLGGAAPNQSSLARSITLQVRLFASYGMTETSSMIANSLVTPGYEGGLRLLNGYSAHIIDPDEDGVGRLAVKGCGVFDSYLNARATRTVDGYFLTGDSAAFRDGRLYVQERTEDLFVSGGENVYPAEIRKKLLDIPAVADAFVFGAPDPVWGWRPVAFVERKAPHPLADLQLSAQTNLQLAAEVRESLAHRLSRVYLPDAVFALDAFPRTGVGKVDRQALLQRFDERILVKKVVLHRIRLPFKKPFRTSKGTLRARESLLVQVIDHEGRSGLGECVAFSSDWYLPETLRDDLPVLRDTLAPALIGRPMLHPADAFDALSAVPGALPYPLAMGAIESAVWDLYGRITGKPLWKLLNECYAEECAAAVAESASEPAQPSASGPVFGVPVTGAASGVVVGASAGSPSSAGAEAAPAMIDSMRAVPAGAVIGMGSVAEVLASARQSVQAGYKRLKLKVAPGCAYALARAVREAFPDIVITLDANQSFWESQADELRALADLDIAWIEEPLRPSGRAGEAPGDLFARLAQLQRTMKTPICLDESIARPRDLLRALSYPELRCYAVKVGKMGGIAPTLRFVALAAERGLQLWMGGMYDTGISRRVAAAFETLPGMDVPGDIGSTARYFHTDIATPPYAVEAGSIYLNRPPFVSGLGCVLNEPALESVTLERTAVE